MAVTAGMRMLLALLFLLAGPPVITFIAKRLLDYLGIFLPKWIYMEMKQRREAASMGARFAPRIKGKWPGNLDVMARVIRKFMNGYPGEEQVELMKKYGYFFNAHVLHDDVIFTTTPEHIQQILATDFKNYEKGTRFRKDMGAVLGVGVFNADGDMWKFHRQMTRPFFTRDRVTHFDIFDRHAESALTQMKRRLRTGYPIDFQDLMGRFTLDSATEFLFGSCVHSLSANPPYPYYAPAETAAQIETPEAQRAQEFAKAFLEAQEVVGQRVWIGPLWPLLSEFWGDKTIAPMKIVNSFIEPIIATALERKKASARLPKDEKDEIDDDQTLLDHLVDLTDDPTMLRDEILNIMIAGRDTTASTLTFITYFLATYPDVATRLRNEVLATVGPSQRPTYDNIREMKYLRAVINETLRLYPVVPFNVRQCVNSTTWPSLDPTEKPVYIPAGAKLPYSVFLMHRRKDLWGPDAEEFDPDRFLDERLKKYLTSRPFIFLPFNAGPRICLGQQFAYNEMSFMLIRLMQNFEEFKFEPSAAPPEYHTPPEWKNASGRQAVDKFLPKLTLTMYSGGGLWIRAKEVEDRNV